MGTDKVAPGLTRVSRLLLLCSVLGVWTFGRTPVCPHAEARDAGGAEAQIQALYDRVNEIWASRDLPRLAREVVHPKAALIIARPEGMRSLNQAAFAECLRSVDTSKWNVASHVVQKPKLVVKGGLAVCLSRAVTTLHDGTKRKADRFQMLCSTPEGWRMAFSMPCNVVWGRTLAPGPGANTSGPEVAAVRKTLQGVAHAVRRRNAEALGEFYLTSASLTVGENGGRLCIATRDEIVETCRRAFAGGAAMGYETYRFRAIRVIQQGPLALAQTVRTLKGKDGKLVRQPILFALLKQGEAWRIVLDAQALVRIQPARRAKG